MDKSLASAVVGTSHLRWQTRKNSGGKDIMSRYGATVTILMLYKHRNIEIFAP